jgi:chemotaxis protein MotB
MSQSNDLSEDPGTGYLLSISDLMSGLLFIFIILLAVFVVNFKRAIQEQEQINIKLNDVVNGLTENNQRRSDLLKQIQVELQKKNINVHIDLKHGILRLKEDTIRFTTGGDRLNETQLERLNTIGDVLASIIPCYASNPAESYEENPYLFSECDENIEGKLDSIFIEGHTDNVPIGGNLARKFKDNWDLSASRSIYTFRALVTRLPALSLMKNTSEQPIFSVSGYGDGRPVPGHYYPYPKNDPENRRIDIRFIMTPPKVPLDNEQQ